MRTYSTKAVPSPKAASIITMAQSIPMSEVKAVLPKQAPDTATAGAGPETQHPRRLLGRDP